MVGDKLVGVNVVTKWTSLYSRTSGGLKVKLSSLSLILSLAGLSTCISSTFPLSAHGNMNFLS